jgi:glutamyl-tRNA reductase
MHITCLGLNHTTTNINLRERLAFSDENIRAALARIGCGGWPATPSGRDFVPEGYVAELVIVSTCNRIELYVVSSAVIFAELETFLLDAAPHVDREELRPHLYRFKDMDAVRHLFEVAAGLDSLVIGEPQILGQITRALELARGQNAAGPVLNRLFQAAIHAGKRVRTETAISRNPASVSSLAASLAERSVHPIADAQIAVLGAGEMAELAVEALRKRGVKNILVVNRTLERAHTLAQRWDAQATTFEHLDTALECADILIASTGAPHTIISVEMVKTAMQVRAQRPLVLIDIAVPRDIDSEIAQLPHVRLYDIDHLNDQMEHSLAGRMAEVPHVKEILEDELDEFSEYLQSLDMLPLIADIHQQAETIRRAELERTLRRLPDLTDEERARIEILTQSLVKKLLDSPTSRLRAEATCPHAPEYASVARTLFGLKNESGLCSFSGSTCPISCAAE